MIRGMDDLFFLRDESEADIAMISAIKSENGDIAHFEFKYHSVNRVHKITYRMASTLCDFFTNYIENTRPTNLAHYIKKPVSLLQSVYLTSIRMIYPRYAYEFHSSLSFDDTEFDEFCTFHVVAEENDRKRLSMIYLRDEAVAVDILDDDSCKDFVDFFRSFDHQDAIKS